MKRPTRAWAPIVGVAILVLAVLKPSPGIIEFFEIDRCLDRGGAWNDEAGACRTE